MTDVADLSGVTGLLAPLRERYADWLRLDADGVREDREEAATDVRALPLVVRMEREAPPSWHAAMVLAARGSALICLDERAQEGGPWHDAVAAYAAGHIRKVTRRARGAHWAAIADLPGLTLGHPPTAAAGGPGPSSPGDRSRPADQPATEVRVLVPGLVTELDPRVARLQVGGTDAPVDEPGPDPGVPHLAVLVPPEPVTTLGKAMAQSGHAGMIFAALAAEDRPELLTRWYAAGCPVAVHRVDATTWAERLAAVTDPARGWTEHGLLAVRDAGFTEVAPGTITVIGAWSDPANARGGPVGSR